LGTINAMKYEISIDYGKLDISYSRILSSLSRHFIGFSSSALHPNRIASADLSPHPF